MAVDFHIGRFAARRLTRTFDNGGLMVRRQPTLIRRPSRRRKGAEGQMKPAKRRDWASPKAAEFSAVLVSVVGPVGPVGPDPPVVAPGLEVPVEFADPVAPELVALEPLLAVPDDP